MTLRPCFAPKNTTADTEKCVRLFQSWGQARNLHFPSDKVPMDILLTDDHALLTKWLCRFSTEARKIGSEPYPPKTLQHCLMGIQRHIRKQKENQINLMLTLHHARVCVCVCVCTCNSCLHSPLGVSAQNGRKPSTKETYRRLGQSHNSTHVT